jgi:guanine deaminase
MGATLVRGKIFNPLGLTEWQYFEDGALRIDESGYIQEIGDYQHLKSLDGLEMLDYSGYLILPGLIDMHTHLPQLPIRGKVAGTLLEWLDRYAFPIERAFAEPAYAQRLSECFFKSLLANGTTTALVLSSVHEASTHLAFEAAAQCGMRVLMGKVMMDQHAPDFMLENTAASLEGSQRLASRWHCQNKGLIRYAFTPRFALTCSMVMLEGIAQLHRQFPDSYIHSHLAENKAEIAAVTALYQNRHSYTQIYEKSGCLGPRTLMAHGIYLSESELAILKETQTRIAHCPSSNFFLKSGVFPLDAVQHAQIAFGLGSDIGGGPDISMFRVMRSMVEIQLTQPAHVKPTEAIYYATLAGAEALSLESETGNLSPGKSADFIVLDTDTLTSLSPQGESIEEILSQLVSLGGEKQVMKTFVRGKAVFSNDRG